MVHWKPIIPGRSLWTKEREIMNNSIIKIFNAGGPVAVNLNQIRLIRANTEQTSTITWVDGSATNFQISFNDLMEILYDIHPEEAEENKPVDPNEIQVEDLNLSVGSYNALKRVGINTVADIITHTYDEIRDLRTCGRKRAWEIKETVEALGFSLK